MVFGAPKSVCEGVRFAWCHRSYRNFTNAPSYVCERVLVPPQSA
jgi:hypothetical protein